MYGYICMYKGKKFEVYTDKGIYVAQLLGAQHFGVKTSKSFLVSTTLCELPSGDAVVQVAVN